MFRSLGDNLLLITLFIYLSLGNLARIINLNGFLDNQLITEMILYIAVIIYAIFSGKLVTNVVRLFFLYLIIILSSIWGMILYGFEIEQFLYGPRLILIIFTSTMFGEIMFSKYNFDIKTFLDFFLKSYLIVVIIGYVIYYVFPQSISFWAFLANFGIVFNGDPHIHRFISGYLDPNYYAIIGLLPIIISLYLFNITLKKKYLFFALITMISVFLSGSRSGTTAMFAYLLLSTNLVAPLVSRKFNKSLIYVFFGVGIMLLTIPLYLENLITLFGRLFEVSNDPSALSRLSSAQFAWEVIKKNVFLGTGYNYTSLFNDGIHYYPHIDSSILLIIASFGVVTSIGFALFLFNKLNKVRKKINLLNDKSLKSLFLNLMIYLCISIFFSSTFNNVLLYQFWLVPIIIIFSYISRLSQESNNEENFN